MAAVNAAAQLPGALNETTATRMGGSSYIVGTVFWPTGRPVNFRMSVKLVTPTAGEYLITTDDRGQFIFSGLREGIYFVVIDGEKDFEPVNQPVDVLSSRSGKDQPYTVTIRLAEKRKTAAKPAVVEAANAEVPKRAKAHYAKALELSATKDHKGAVEQLKLAVAADPNFISGYNELGVQYLKLNDLERAGEALQAALKIKPDAPEPLANRGILLFRLNKWDEAHAALTSSIAADGRSSVAHYYLARTLVKLSRFDEAEKQLDLVIKLQGAEMNEAYRILAMMYIEKDDRPKALAALETYLKLVPAAPDADRLRQAAADIKRSMDKNP